MCLSLGQSRRCAQAWCDARVECTVRHRIRESIKGEHAGQRTDYFRARSVLYLLPTLPRTGLRITPPPDATCKPLEAILAALRMLLISQLQQPREGYDLRRA